MGLCEERVKSRGKSGTISSDLLFENVRIRFAIRTYGPNNSVLFINENRKNIDIITNIN